MWTGWHGSIERLASAATGIFPAFLLPVATAIARVGPRHRRKPKIRCDGEERLRVLATNVDDRRYREFLGLAGATSHAAGPPVADFRLRRALSFMREHLYEPCSINQVARACGVSRPHFYGTGVAELLRMLRHDIIII